MNNNIFVYKTYAITLRRDTDPGYFLSLFNIYGIVIFITFSYLILCYTERDLDQY